MSHMYSYSFIVSIVFFNIYNDYNIAFKGIITIQYFSYDNIGGK